MSVWEVNYHREKLELLSGTRWVRDYSGNDAARLFIKLEESRGRLSAFETYEQTMRAAFKIGYAALVVGLVLAVFSSVRGFDYGVACGALIAPGAIIGTLSFVGAILLRINVTSPLSQEVRQCQTAYDTAIAKAAGR